jgi:hypothetical protein
VLADVLGLVGSSPTPGASDVGSTTKRNKNKQTEFVFNTKSKRDMVLQKSQIEENNTLYSSSTNTEELVRKIRFYNNWTIKTVFQQNIKGISQKEFRKCNYYL